MAIAVISDIHGNVPALEAVIEDLRHLQVDEVLVCGDLVGRGPQGHAVVRRIAELGWRCLKGNHEDFLERIRCSKLRETDLLPSTWPALQWMAKDLTVADDAFIEALPMTLEPESATGMRLFHGSPQSFSRGIGSWTVDAELRSHWESADAQLLVCAHTHRTMERTVADGSVVNVGSVGLPFNGDTRSQYAVFSPSRGRWEVSFRRIDYDRDGFKRIFDSSGFLAAGGIYARLLLREVETARSHLVPYMKWCKLTENPFTFATMERFLSDFTPGESQSAFFERLRISLQDDDDI